MPRKTRKTVLVESPVDDEQPPARLTRQGTSAKTSGGSPSNAEMPDEGSPPRATRGRPRKTKNLGSPPKPTRTMPRRGRKQVQFTDDVDTIPEETAAVKENVDPVSSDRAESPPKNARKGKRRTRKVEGPQEAEHLAGSVTEDIFHKGPEEIQTADSTTVENPATETSSAPELPKKRSRRGKRSKEEPVNPQPLVREGTFTKSPEKNTSQEAQEIHNESLQGTGTEESTESTSDQPGLAREGTFSKSPNKIIRSEEDVGVSSPLRRTTFTTTPRRSKRASPKSSDQENMPAFQREGTFTKTSDPSETSGKETVESPQSSGDGPLKRERTFTRTPEKTNHKDIPTFRVDLSTPGPVESLNVFQRLSSRISLSARRSLVSSGKTSSLKKFSTPQPDKRAQLTALREARKNHLTPKSISFKRGTTLSTPAEPAIKAASSTKRPKSAVKKPPNFAAIHERNFAKMESLLENRKRLRDRADFLMSPLRAPQASGIPKLVKKDVASSVSNVPAKKSHIPVMAKKANKERLKAVVANKCQTGSLLKEDRKQVLKGVRTNKRFELLLKQRNMQT